MDHRQTRVLIVGAGPAGLVAALDLTRRGVGVVIVDRAPGPSDASRAKGIQPRSLEVFERLGVVDRVLAAGGAFPRWRSYRSGRVAWEKSIYELLGIGEPVADAATPFPETWMVAQWRTEQILREALAGLGVRAEFGSALTGLDVTGSGVTAVLAGDRPAERIEARYLVAADGAASTVRKLVGIPFDGVTRDDERYLIADVRTADLDRDHWHNFSHPDDPAARVSICPLPGTDTFQYVAPLLSGEPPLTLATVQRLFDERSDGGSHGCGATFTDAPWITTSRANERLAGSFREGPVFLVGDAAHTVPATGGQGMNTAIQDADNLGWKLAAVLAGAPEALLDSYQEERRPIAARLMAGLGTVDDQGETPDVFQLRNNYRGTSLALEARRLPGAVRAGDRAPDAPVLDARIADTPVLDARIADTPVPGAWTAGPSRLFEMFRSAEPTCLAFGDRAVAACRTVAAKWAIQVFGVRRDSPASAETISRTYDVGVDEQVVFVVRPDGHVGLVTDRDLESRLAEYLPRIVPG